MSAPSSILIVGAGHCGGRTVQALRAQGFAGRIDLVGDEPGLPYERPALSKGVLTGSRTPESLDLLSEAQLQELGVQRHLAQVLALDAAARTAQLSNGQTLPYGALLLAHGGAVRRLSIPGAELDAVYTLRNKADANRLAAALQPGRRIVVVGGGFIGLEVAASARTRGCSVDLVEGGSQLMGRAVPALLAQRALQLHRAQGVRIQLGVVPQAIAPQAQGVAVQLSNGQTLLADAVVVGIGIVPHTALAQAAGVQVARGILVDRCLRTNVAQIYAAGDVAEFPSPLSGAWTRQETWQNAEDQARVAAHNLCGENVEFRASAWFWSDQYDHQLQVCGEPAAGTQLSTRAYDDGDVLLFSSDDAGRLVGACGWGLASRIARELKLARMLVERGATVDPALLADPAIKLKALLR